MAFSDVQPSIHPCALSCPTTNIENVTRWKLMYLSFAWVWIDRSIIERLRLNEHDGVSGGHRVNVPGTSAQKPSLFFQGQAEKKSRCQHSYNISLWPAVRSFSFSFIYPTAAWICWCRRHTLVSSVPLTPLLPLMGIGFTPSVRRYGHYWVVYG